MTWSDRQYSFTLLYGLDRFAAAIFFMETRMSISALCGVIRRGNEDKIAKLKLRAWQRKFLTWLEPKLSAEHCLWAITNDLARVQSAVEILS